MINNNFIIHESATVATPTMLSPKNTGILEFVAVLQEAGKKNRNGRIYPKSVLQEGLNSPYIQERLRTKTLYAECGHPLNTDLVRQMTIDVRNAVCIIKELWWEGDLLMGKCETTNTSLGRDFKGLLEQGSIVGFSLRAQGKVHPDNMMGALVVDSPIKICTWDFVVNPSHDQAFLKSICEETYSSLIKPEIYKDEAMALCEATKEFEDGRILEINENMKIERDFTKNYFAKSKPLSETYIRTESETIQELNENTIVLLDESGFKKVKTDDFLMKDIRCGIAGLSESYTPESFESQTEFEEKINL